MAVSIGDFLAMFGQTGNDATFLPFFPGAAAGLIALAVSKWPTKRTIPHLAEAANLKVFLTSTDATAASDRRQVRRLWAHVGVVASAYAVAVPLAGWLRVRAFGLDFDPTMLAPLAGRFAVIAAVILSIRFLLENAHRPKSWARRVAIGESGMRFGRLGSYRGRPRSVEGRRRRDARRAGLVPAVRRHDYLALA
jgi:hypothetical protein